MIGQSTRIIDGSLTADLENVIQNIESIQAFPNIENVSAQLGLSEIKIDTNEIKKVTDSISEVISARTQLIDFQGEFGQEGYLESIFGEEFEDQQIIDHVQSLFSELVISGETFRDRFSGIIRDTFSDLNSYAQEISKRLPKAVNKPPPGPAFGGDIERLGTADDFESDIERGEDRTQFAGRLEDQISSLLEARRELIGFAIPTANETGRSLQSLTNRLNDLQQNLETGDSTLDRDRLEDFGRGIEKFKRPLEQYSEFSRHFVRAAKAIQDNPAIRALPEEFIQENLSGVDFQRINTDLYETLQTEYNRVAVAIKNYQDTLSATRAEITSAETLGSKGLPGFLPSSDNLRDSLSALQEEVRRFDKIFLQTQAESLFKTTRGGDEDSRRIADTLQEDLSRLYNADLDSLAENTIFAELIGRFANLLDDPRTAEEVRKQIPDIPRVSAPRSQRFRGDDVSTTGRTGYLDPEDFISGLGPALSEQIGRGISESVRDQIRPFSPERDVPNIGTINVDSINTEEINRTGESEILSFDIADNIADQAAKFQELAGNIEVPTLRDSRFSFTEVGQDFEQLAGADTENFVLQILQRIATNYDQSFQSRLASETSLIGELRGAEESKAVLNALSEIIIFVNSLRKGFPEILDLDVPIFSNDAPLSETLGKSAINIDLDNELESFKKTAQEINDGLLSLTPEQQAKFATQYKNIVSELGGEAGEEFSGALTSVLETFKLFQEDLLPNIASSGNIENLEDALFEISEKFLEGESRKTLIDNVNKTADLLGGQLGETFKQGLKDVIDFTDEVASYLIGKSPPEKGALSDLPAGARKAFQSYVDEIPNVSLDGVRNLGTRLSDAINQAVQNIDSQPPEVIEAIDESIENVKENLEEISDISGQIKDIEIDVKASDNKGLIGGLLSLAGAGIGASLAARVVQSLSNQGVQVNEQVSEAVSVPISIAVEGVTEKVTEVIREKIGKVDIPINIDIEESDVESSVEGISKISKKNFSEFITSLKDITKEFGGITNELREFNAEFRKTVSGVEGSTNRLEKGLLGFTLRVNDAVTKTTAGVLRSTIRTIDSVAQEVVTTGTNVLVDSVSFAISTALTAGITLLTGGSGALLAPIIGKIVNAISIPVEIILSGIQQIIVRAFTLSIRLIITIIEKSLNFLNTLIIKGIFGIGNRILGVLANIVRSVIRNVIPAFRVVAGVISDIFISGFNHLKNFVEGILKFLEGPINTIKNIFNTIIAVPRSIGERLGLIQPKIEIDDNEIEKSGNKIKDSISNLIEKIKPEPKDSISIPVDSETPIEKIKNLGDKVKESYEDFVNPEIPITVVPPTKIPVVENQFNKIKDAIKERVGGIEIPIELGRSISDTVLDQPSKFAQKIQVSESAIDKLKDSIRDRIGSIEIPIELGKSTSESVLSGIKERIPFREDPKRDGKSVGSSYVEGIADGINLAADGGHFLSSLKNLGNFLIGSSPPPRGPLSKLTSGAKLAAESYIIPFIETLSSYIRTGLSAVLTRLANTLSSLNPIDFDATRENISDKISDRVDSIRDSIKETRDSLSSSLSEIRSSPIASLRDALPSREQIAEVLPTKEQISGVADSIKTIPESIKGVPNSIRAVQDSIRDTVDSIKDIDSKDVKSALKNTGAGIITFATDTSSAIRNLANEFIVYKEEISEVERTILGLENELFGTGVDIDFGGIFNLGVDIDFEKISDIEDDIDFEDIFNISLEELGTYPQNIQDLANEFLDVINIQELSAEELESLAENLEESISHLNSISSGDVFGAFPQLVVESIGQLFDLDNFQSGEIEKYATQIVDELNRFSDIISNQSLTSEQFKDLENDLESNIENIAEKIDEIVNIAGSEDITFEKTADSLEETDEKASRVLSVLNNIREVLADISTRVAPKVSQALDFSSGKLDSALESSAAQDIKDELELIAPAVRDNISSAFNELFEIVNRVVPSAGKIIRTGLVGAFKTVKLAITNVIPAVQKLFALFNAIPAPLKILGGFAAVIFGIGKALETVGRAANFKPVIAEFNASGVSIHALREAAQDTVTDFELMSTTNIGASWYDWIVKKGTW